MAWIVLDLDDTLVQEDGQGGSVATEGAVEAIQTLESEGHRLTVYTARFAPMPESERNRLKQDIEQELASLGFPAMEVWTGTCKPSADIFIGDNNITYDNDWGMVLMQLQQMLEDRGLIPGPEAGMMLDGGDVEPSTEETQI